MRNNLVRTSQLTDVMLRNPYAKGVARLRALLDQPQTLHDTRSLYERRLLRLLREAELPLPVTNVTAAGHLVDALWPDLKLVVEFDGWTDHGKRDRFETDRLRDQHLAATGHQAMRITARQINDRPYALVARIASVIATLRVGR
jgi:very-short-patch-repair endonuclease